MRAIRLAFLFSTLLVIVGTARAGAPEFPQYDTVKVCRTQAEYAFAATLGEADIEREQAACRLRERDNMVGAQTLWLSVSTADRTECLGLAEGRYGYLLRCLYGSRSIRTAR